MSPERGGRLPPPRSSEQIKAEIEGRLGFFPGWYVPALNDPEILETLWQLTQSAYLDNPLPPLFKESLLAYLGRFCPVPYALRTHSAALHAQGMASREVLELLKTPPPFLESELEQRLGAQVSESLDLQGWPAQGSSVEKTLFACAVVCFVRNPPPPRFEGQLRQQLGPLTYYHVTSLLTYARHAHRWAKTHRDLSYDEEPHVAEHLALLLAEESRLGPFFDNYRERVEQERAERESFLIAQVADRERAAIRWAAQYMATRALSEQVTLGEAMTKILEATCTALGWQIGASFGIDVPSGVLRCDGFWKAPAFGTTEFEVETRKLVLAPGMGLPGRVWATGEPLWISDVLQDSTFLRSRTAVKNGVRGAFAFPVRVGAEILGTMEFFSHNVQHPDVELLTMMAAVGSQIGQLIKRTRAQEALRESEARKVLLQESLRKSEHMSALGQLVAGVAHEVRNPLFGITATLDAFQSRFGAREEFVRYFDALRAEVDRLTKLTRDLFEYGKPPGLELSLGPIDEVVGQAEQICAPLAQQAGVYIENLVPGSLPRVRRDPARLLQVFQNVVQNAIQHAPAGTVVRLSAEVLEAGERSWVVSRIEDSGSGFAAEDLPRVFEPFFTKRRGGTGLGLSIVHRIVEQHGGRIVASNRPEGGGRVEIWLPDTVQRSAR